MAYLIKRTPGFVIFTEHLTISVYDYII